MSDSHPPLPPYDGEILGPPETQPAREGGRKFAVIGTVIAVIVALLGGAAFAAYQFLGGGGPRPESVLPASTFAEISLDLDPHAGQKIEAIKTIRKFPLLRKTLGVESQDDLRKAIFKAVLGQGDCGSVDFTRDIKPWLGERAAFAGVNLGKDDVAPAIALQITDATGAKAGMKKIVDCTGTSDFFYALGTDYLIASDTQQHADAILAAGEKNPLDQDTAFQSWSDRVGEKGIVNFYVAKSAGKFLVDRMESMFGGMVPGGGSASSFSSSEFSTKGTSAPIVAEGGNPPNPFDFFRQALASFSGMAGTLRFADGGVELVVVSGSDKAGAVTNAPSAGPAVSALPSDTALAFGAGVPPNYAQQLVKYAGQDPEFQKFVRASGLHLPADLQTLLGTAVTLSLGGDAPKDLNATRGPQDLPLGLVLHTDPAKADQVLRTAERHLGFRLSDVPLTTARTDSTFVLSTKADYAKKLTEKGSLGDTSAFRQAVPDADKATVIFFAVINDSWRQAIESAASNGLSPSDQDALKKNLAPLEAIGLSTSVDGKNGVFRLRIATR